MLIATLFIAGKTWMQRRGPSTDGEKINTQTRTTTQRWEEMHHRDLWKTTLKRPHTVWLQLPGILGRAQLRAQRAGQRLPGAGKEGMDSGDTKGFQGSENTLEDTVMAATCHETFVQTLRRHNTQGEP